MKKKVPADGSQSEPEFIDQDSVAYDEFSFRGDGAGKPLINQSFDAVPEDEDSVSDRSDEDMKIVED